MVAGVAKTLNCNLHLQRFKVLYICGSYSSVLSRLDHRFQGLEIRRAFTVFQLMTILEEARHSLIIIEHDALLYEDAQGMLSTSPKVSAMLPKRLRSCFYSPLTDTFLEDLTRNADRVFYFDEGPRASPRLVAKAFPKSEKSQTTLKVFS